MPAYINGISLLAILCAVAAAVLFLSGYIKGFSSSIDDFETSREDARGDTATGFAWPVCLAVVGAGALIALLGASPAVIAAAPFLSIVSAAVIGALFYIERRLD